MAETILLGMPTRKPSRTPQRNGQTYFIRTFGCQMNEHDSERIGGLLASDGMTATDRPENADVVILNTCTIRENADERLRGYLGSLRRAKTANPSLQIAVGGCMAQKDRAGIQEQADRHVVDVMRPIEAILEAEDHLMKAVYEMVSLDLTLIPVVDRGPLVGVLRSVEVFRRMADILDEAPDEGLIE